MHARQGIAFRSVGRLILDFGGHTVLFASAFALACAVGAWAGIKSTTMRDIADAFIRGSPVDNANGPTPVREPARCRRADLLVGSFLESAASRELHGVRSRDVDCRAGRRVAALASGTLAD